MAPPRETNESSLPFKVYSFTEVSRDQMCSPQQIQEQALLQKRPQATQPQIYYIENVGLKDSAHAMTIKF